MKTKLDDKTSIKIDKGIPLPQRGGTRTEKYPFKDLAVNDSFFVPGQTIRNFSGRLYYKARRYKHRYAIRKVDGGIRVWRIS